jgi:hypothetical protein
MFDHDTTTQKLGNGITLIPSSVEAATEPQDAARPGFQSRGKIEGNFAGSFDSASLRSG